MSSDWPSFSVDQLSQAGIIDRPMDGNHGELHPKTSDFVPYGIPFIMASDLVSGRVDTEHCAHITKEQAATLRKGFAKTGDVLISHKATIGRTAIVDEIKTEFLVLTPQVTYYRVVDNKKLDRHYLKYYFDSQGFQDLFKAWAGGGSTRSYLGITAQLKLPINLPPIEYQKAVSETLGALDDKIENNRRMNHTLETTAQAIFKSWFVDFDPVTAKAAGRKPFGMDDQAAELFPSHFADSEWGPIPDGWWVGSVALLAKYVNGKNFTKGASGSGKMVIRIAELNSGPGMSTVYNDVQADCENIAYPGDLLFSRSGSLDVYRWHRDEALINQHIFKVTPSRFPQWFVYYQLREAMPFFQGIAADKATTMGHIKREHLAQAQTSIPSDDAIIKAADNLITPIYELIYANERESFILMSVRNVLLPRLLSGELRIPQAEKLVDEVA